MPDTAHKAIAVQRLGPIAARLLASTDKAQVAAVFDRSLYIEFIYGLVCLGDPSIGEGPLNLIIAPRDAQQLLRLITPAQPVLIHGSMLHLAGHMLDFSTAEIWRPAPWQAPTRHNAISDALDAVRRFTQTDAPADGLVPFVIAAAPTDPTNPLARIAAPRLNELHCWLEHSLAATNATPPSPPVDLLGLGPGLTPSGDDLLCGVLLTLDALGSHQARDTLAGAVLAAATNLTTPLSAAFLTAAADGLGSAALHDVIATLIAADLDTLPAATAALSRIGHTSGWDALAGVYLTLTAWIAAHQPTQSP